MFPSVSDIADRQTLFGNVSRATITRRFGAHDAGTELHRFAPAFPTLVESCAKSSQATAPAMLPATVMACAGCSERITLAHRRLPELDELVILPKPQPTGRLLGLATGCVRVPVPALDRIQNAQFVVKLWDPMNDDFVAVLNWFRTG